MTPRYLSSYLSPMNLSPMNLSPMNLSFMEPSPMKFSFRPGSRLPASANTLSASMAIRILRNNLWLGRCLKKGGTLIGLSLDELSDFVRGYIKGGREENRGDFSAYNLGLTQ